MLCINYVLVVISDSTHWKRLEEHAKVMKNVHLKTLLQDSDRCKALVASQDGIYLDYCRQSIHVDTMVCSILSFRSSRAYFFLFSFKRTCCLN
jgi:hypothetical protein